MHTEREAGNPRARASRRVAALLTALAVLLLVPAGPAGAEPSPAEASARREQIRREQADIASRIEPLQSTAQELADAVRVLEANERAQAAKVADARKASDEARQRHEWLIGQQAELEGQQDALRGRVTDRAISSYVNPAGRVDETDLMLRSSDVTSADRKRELVNSVTGTNRDAIDQLRANREAIVRIKDQAEAASREADDKQKEAEVALEAQHRATQDKLKVKAAYDDRIAGLRAEANTLAAEDANLQQLIADAQARFAAQVQAVAQQRADEEARARAAATTTAAPTTGAPGSSAPASSAPGSSAAPTTGRAAPAPPGPSTSGRPPTTPAPPPPSTGGGRMVWPLPGGRVSQEFGGNHAGMDIFAPHGSPVVAGRSGVVISAGFNNGGYGNLILVDHGGGIVTAYAHLSAFQVSVGQSVGAGQTIGLEGSTGRSTGPHLHFEVRVNGRAQNPRGYL